MLNLRLVAISEKKQNTLTSNNLIFKFKFIVFFIDYKSTNKFSTFSTKAEHPRKEQIWKISTLTELPCGTYWEVIGGGDMT